MSGELEGLFSELGGLGKPEGLEKPEEENLFPNFTREDYIRKNLPNRAKYIDLIRKEAKAKNIPENLALAQLYTESSFNPLALSKANARGIAQFIPSTGRQYGLVIEGDIDERTDPYKAVPAAMRYITDLKRWAKRDFPNSSEKQQWEMVLQGYNAGYKKVKKYKGQVPYDETKAYLKRILERTGGKPAEAPAKAPAKDQSLEGLFGELGGLGSLTSTQTSTVGEKQETVPLYYDRGDAAKGHQAQLELNQEMSIQRKKQFSNRTDREILRSAMGRGHNIQLIAKALAFSQKAIEADPLGEKGYLLVASTENKADLIKDIASIKAGVKHTDSGLRHAEQALGAALLVLEDETVDPEIRKLIEGLVNKTYETIKLKAGQFESQKGFAEAEKARKERSKYRFDLSMDLKYRYVPEYKSARALYEEAYKAKHTGPKSMTEMGLGALEIAFRPFDLAGMALSKAWLPEGVEATPENRVTHIRDEALGFRIGDSKTWSTRGAAANFVEFMSDLVGGGLFTIGAGAVVAASALHYLTEDITDVKFLKGEFEQAPGMEDLQFKARPLNVRYPMGIDPAASGSILRPEPSEVSGFFFPKKGEKPFKAPIGLADMWENAIITVAEAHRDGGDMAMLMLTDPLTYLSFFGTAASAIRNGAKAALMKAKLPVRTLDTAQEVGTTSGRVLRQEPALAGPSRFGLQRGSQELAPAPYVEKYGAGDFPKQIGETTYPKEAVDQVMEFADFVQTQHATGKKIPIATGRAAVKPHPLAPIDELTGAQTDLPLAEIHERLGRQMAKRGLMEEGESVLDAALRATNALPERRATLSKALDHWRPIALTGDEAAMSVASEIARKIKHIDNQAGFFSDKFAYMEAQMNSYSRYASTLKASEQLQEARVAIQQTLLAQKEKGVQGPITKLQDLVLRSNPYQVQAAIAHKDMTLAQMLLDDTVDDVAGLVARADLEQHVPGGPVYHSGYPATFRALVDSGVPADEIHRQFGTHGNFFGARKLMVHPATSFFQEMNVGGKKISLSFPLSIPGIDPYAGRKMLQRFGPRFKDPLRRVAGEAARAATLLDPAAEATRKVNPWAAKAPEEEAKWFNPKFQLGPSKVPLASNGRALRLTRGLSSTTMREFEERILNLMVKEGWSEDEAFRLAILKDHQDPQYVLVNAEGVMVSSVKGGPDETARRLLPSYLEELPPGAHPLIPDQGPGLIADPAEGYKQSYEYIKNLRQLARKRKLSKNKLDYELGVLQKKLDQTAERGAIQWKTINKVDNLVADVNNAPRTVRQRIWELKAFEKEAPAGVKAKVKERLIGDFLDFSGTELANSSIKQIVYSGTLTNKEADVIIKGILKRRAKLASKKPTGKIAEILGNMDEELRLLDSFKKGKLEAPAPSAKKKRPAKAAEPKPEPAPAPPPEPEPAPVLRPEEAVARYSERLPDDVVKFLDLENVSEEALKKTLDSLEDDYLLQLGHTDEIKDAIKTLKNNYENTVWEHPGPGPWRSTVWEPGKQRQLFDEKQIATTPGLERPQASRLPEIYEEIIETSLKKAELESGGIGFSYRKLMDAFGSEKAILSATKDELAKVKGVGKKRAELLYDKIREVTVEKRTVSRPTNITMKTLDSVFGGRKIVRVVGEPGLDDGGKVKTVDDLKKHINFIRKKKGEEQKTSRERTRQMREAAYRKDPRKPFTPELVSPGKRGYITLRHMGADGQGLLKETKLNIDDFEELFFREIDPEDIGIRTTYFERNITKGFGEFGQIGAEAGIQYDNTGVRYAVRAVREGDAEWTGAPVRLSDPQAEWLAEYNSVMNDFHGDLVRQGILEADQLGYNPLSGVYFPRNNIGGFHFFEDAIFSKGMAGGKTRLEKKRGEAFGRPFGAEKEIMPVGALSTLERIKDDALAAWKAHDGAFSYRFIEDLLTGIYKRTDDRWRQSAMDPKRVLPAYARAASRRIAARNLELGVMELFGVTKASRLKVVTKDAEGRIIDDPSDLEQGYYTEAIGDDVWEAFVHEAEAGKGKIKILKNEEGVEVAVPAEAYRWVQEFNKEGLGLFQGYRETLSTTPGGRGMMEVLKLGATMSNAFKRSVLVGRPQYHAINMMNDSLQLLTMGMNRPAHWVTEARKLIKNPEGYKLKLSNGKTVDGVSLLKSAREQGLVSHTSARIDVFGGDAINLADRLELESIRHSGKGLNWQKWNKKAKNWGIKEGEVFAAWWTDHAQMAGYMYRIKHGDTASMAAKRTFDALIDYSDRDMTLNVLRFFAPFATWAAKAPAMAAKAFVNRPGAVTLPIRWFESLEAGAERREGPTFAKPPWMVEAGGYYRVPTSGKEAYSTARQFGGGSRLSEPQQFFLRSRIPYIDAWSPIAATAEYALKGRGPSSLAPWAMHLSPTAKLAVETLSEKTVLTGQEIGGPQFSKPFAFGTRFVPEGMQAEAGQQAWLARHYTSHFSAIPYIGPLFSPIFINEINAANQTGKFFGVKVAEPYEGGPAAVLGGRRISSVSRDPIDDVAKQRVASLMGISGKAISPGKAIAHQSQDQEEALEQSAKYFRELYTAIQRLIINLERKRKEKR